VVFTIRGVVFFPPPHLNPSASGRGLMIINNKNVKDNLSLHGHYVKEAHALPFPSLCGPRR
jgi:hypothetical protein